MKRKLLLSDWVLKGFRAIFKELFPEESLRKIDVSGSIFVKGHEVQSIVCIVFPTNRYFRIDFDRVFVRKRFCVIKDEKTLLIPVKSELTRA